MNQLAKLALLSTALFSMGALTACQSINKPQEPMMEKTPHMHHHRPHMSPEDMEKRKAAFEQFKQACNNQPVGAKVQVKLGDQTIAGSCELRFQPERPAKPAMPMPAPQTTSK